MIRNALFALAAIVMTATGFTGTVAVMTAPATTTLVA